MDNGFSISLVDRGTSEDGKVWMDLQIEHGGEQIRLSGERVAESEYGSPMLRAVLLKFTDSFPIISGA